MDSAKRTGLGADQELKRSGLTLATVQFNVTPNGSGALARLASGILAAELVQRNPIVRDWNAAFKACADLFERLHLCQHSLRVLSQMTVN